MFAGDQSFWLLYRAFWTYCSYAVIIAMIIALVIGVKNIEVAIETNTGVREAALAGLYEISVVCSMFNSDKR